MLGELPPYSGYRGYYHLEDTTDSSGNSLTLTNSNSVAFNAGLFNKSADFGSSGTNKGLTRTVNNLTALQVANLTVSGWFRFNSTSNSTANSRFFEIKTTALNSTTGMLLLLFYTVTSGNLTIGAQNVLTTTTAQISYSFGAINTTQKHHFALVLSGTTTITLYIDGVQVATNTGVGTQKTTDTSTILFDIGNARVLTSQAWCKLDEFVVEERSWTAAEIRRYYTNAIGRNV